ncbi:MAG: extracellular solute-binding protein, partial [Clostridia bacterium]|nr:extracellular solute-binding protein [Clostridia bacterium]
KNNYIIKEQTGDVYNDAQFALTAALEEKFGIVMEEIISADDAYGTAPQAEILAGDDTYHLLSGHARSMFTYSSQNLAYDWYTLPHIQFDNQWWDQNMLTGMSIGGKIYMLPDDLTEGSLAETKCYMINKDLFTVNNVALPYEAALNGTWTFDMMREMVTVFTNDLNGDGAMELTKDQFGYVTSWWGAPINILWTAGQRIVDATGEGGRLEYVVNNETTVDVFDTYLAFLSEPGAVCENVDGGPDGTAAFKEGRVAITESWIDKITWSRDLDFDIGLIPYPKFYAEQDRYYTGVDAGSAGLVVPVTIADAEMTSAVLEYWMYLQYRDVLPVYYETVCKTKAARDEETGLILDLIRDSRLYDIGYFHNELTLNSIGRELVANNVGFATYYAQNEKKAQSAIDKVNEFYFEN